MLSVAQLDERIEKCLAILADNPHSQVFAALAEAYRKRGEFGRAFAVCKGGLKHHPDYGPAHLVMAKLFLHQGMHAAALESLKRCEAAEGVSRASEYLEAEIRIGMRDVPGARAILDRLRSTDRGNPALRELFLQLREVTAAPERAAESDQFERGEPNVTTAPAETVTSESFDWPTWAAQLAARPHVLKAFAISLSEGETMPFAVIAEHGRGLDGVDVVGVCAALFAAVDADCRAQGRGHLCELRVEQAEREWWCRRMAGCVIGLAGERGFAFGATRQQALDGAERLHPTETVR